MVEPALNAPLVPMRRYVADTPENASLADRLMLAPEAILYIGRILGTPVTGGDLSMRKVDVRALSIAPSLVDER